MTKTHQITCAHDDCPEWSVQKSFQPVDRRELADRHRRGLAEEGWVDVEGRDYCPDHAPAA